MDEFNRQGPTPASATDLTPAPEHGKVSDSKDKKSKMSKPSGKQTTIGIIVILLLVVAAGAAIFFWGKYNDSQKQVEKLSNTPTNTAAAEQKALVTEIGKLTVLPTGESPTVATVTDITKLSDQPFFAKAANGDKVLIYTQAKEAYLYRPSTNKIINIAPVNLGSSSSTTTTPSTTTPTSSTTKKP